MAGVENVQQRSGALRLEVHYTLVAAPCDQLGTQFSCLLDVCAQTLKTTEALHLLHQPMWRGVVEVAKSVQ